MNRPLPVLAPERIRTPTRSFAWVDHRVRDRLHLVHTPDIPRSIYNLELAVRDGRTGESLETADGRTYVSLGQVFMRGFYE